MKELCLKFIICWTYIFGGTFAADFYRTMKKDSKIFGASSIHNSTSPFAVLGKQMTELIEKEKIRNKICGIIRDLCQKQPPKPNITLTVVKPPVTPTSSTVSTPNINISLVFSEPSEHSNDTTCMKFRLPNDSSSGKIVKGADVFVYITTRKKRNSEGKKMRRKRRRRRMRKISIKISLLNEETHQKKFVSRLRFRPDPSKKWYKLVLPFYVIKKAYKMDQRALNLCIECKRCNRKTQVILPLKTTKKRLKFMLTRNQKGNKNFQFKNKKGKALRLRKNRPFLMCHTSEKRIGRKRRETQRCDKDNPYSKCCRYQEYIRFSDIGLGKRVTYPDGFYKTQCIGSCSLNSTSTDLSLTQCVPSSYKPFQTLLVLDSDVMFLDVPQGNIQQCNCQ